MSTSTSTSTTSRIARKPIAIPSGVEIKLQGRQLSIKGPKGHATIAVHPFVKVALEKDHIKVELAAKKTKDITGAKGKLYRAIAGTVRANISNSIQGITHGFERRLALVGVGYRAQAKGKVLSLSLGFSHPTDFSVPEGIVVETPTQTDIVIKGANKELVGLVAAKIRNIRGPEPYKGKGVRYANEVIELKETKKK
jgi:large subunit ribosomal protein L6